MTMTHMKSSLIISSLLFVAVLTGCEGNIDAGKGSADGIRIEIATPSVFGYGSPGTKADGDTRNLSDFAPGLQPRGLEEGSTLWLTYSAQTAGAETPDDPSDDVYSAPELKAYTVRGNSGYTSMYACSFKEITDESGTEMWAIDDTDVSAAPLYLKNGNYRFRMISPAMPIYKDSHVAFVDNGFAFCSSDERYEETSSSTITVEVDDASEVQYIYLKPMIQQTARLRFHLKKGDNVNSLSMMSDGIEISGLQNPVIHDGITGLEYNWSSTDPSDTLVMLRGSKKEVLHIHRNLFHDNPDGSISGETYILPTNAESTDIVMLLNMAVNGVPTQYMTVLNGMIIKHAHSYNLTLTVSMRNNMVVVNWQNTAWTTDIEL